MSRISVIRTTPFNRSAKRLGKKYPAVGVEVDRFVQRLIEGETPGDQIPGVGYAVYKVRISSSDMKRGKSGGYRIIYYVSTPATIYLVEIYAKPQHEDYPVDRLRRIIKEILGD